MSSKQFPSAGSVAKIGGSDLPWEKTRESSFASAYNGSMNTGVVPSSSGPARVNILGVGVSALNMDIALRQTELLLDRGEQGYVCVTGVHGIMEAQSDDAFREILRPSCRLQLFCEFLHRCFEIVQWFLHFLKDTARMIGL